MATLLLGLGLVLAVEGLAFALLPRRIEELLALVSSLSVDARRLIGIAALAIGVALLWSARLLGV